MPNPFYTYILYIYDLVWFYGISTIVGYLMPNPLDTYILYIYDLVWFGLVLFGLIAKQNCLLFNSKIYL